MPACSLAPCGRATAPAKLDTKLPPTAKCADPISATPTSLHHRLWLPPPPYPSAVAARTLARGPADTLADTLAAAVIADSSDPNCVFTTGRCVADPTHWPAPAAHFENVSQLADPDGTLRTVTLPEWEQRQHPDEVCYVDGACFPHVIPSLGRAGWASVFVARGRVTATAFAPVWHSNHLE